MGFLSKPLIESKQSIRDMPVKCIVFKSKSKFEKSSRFISHLTEVSF